MTNPISGTDCKIPDHFKQFDTIPADGRISETEVTEKFIFVFDGASDKDRKEVYRCLLPEARKKLFSNLMKSKQPLCLATPEILSSLDENQRKALALNLSDLYSNTDEKSKEKFAGAIFELAAYEITNMTGSNTVKGLIINIINFMYKNLKSNNKNPRDKCALSAGQILASGEVSGCYESAKLFSALLRKINPDIENYFVCSFDKTMVLGDKNKDTDEKHSLTLNEIPDKERLEISGMDIDEQKKTVYGWIKQREYEKKEVIRIGGHVVIEIRNAGETFLVDPSNFLNLDKYKPEEITFENLKNAKQGKIIKLEEKPTDIKDPKYGVLGNNIIYAKCKNVPYLSEAELREEHLRKALQYMENKTEYKPDIFPVAFEPFDSKHPYVQISEDEVTEDFVKEFIQAKQEDRETVLRLTASGARMKLLRALINLHAGIDGRLKDQSSDAIAFVAAKSSWDILKINEKEKNNILKDLDGNAKEKVLERFKGLYGGAQDQITKTMSANTVFLIIDPGLCKENMRIVRDFFNNKINLESLNSADKLKTFSSIRYFLQIKKYCADASPEYKIKELDELELPQEKYKEFEEFVRKDAIGKIKSMQNFEENTAKKLVINVLKFMNENIKHCWGERGEYEFPAERVLAYGTFNGCVEAAKMFMFLFQEASSGMAGVKCSLIYSFKKDWAEGCAKLDPGLNNPEVWKNPAGHAVIEIQGPGFPPFLVDATAFERLGRMKEPVTFEDLKKSEINILLGEKEDSFKKFEEFECGKDKYIIYETYTEMPKPYKSEKDTGNTPSATSAREWIKKTRTK